MAAYEEQPEDVAAILRRLDAAFATPDSKGRKIGDATFGVYAFYDYDGEPIYVGQTRESLRTRIRRHLTNQRTDAVSMSVLDPFEVAEIEMWPFWSEQELLNANQDDSVESDKGIALKAALNAAEYTAYDNLLQQSTFKAVLNEKPPAETNRIQLPTSMRVSIVPEEVYNRRKHPDIRIAQRAATIARLADIISRRRIQRGLRNTLLTQARRLEHLARRRLDEVERD